MSHPLDRPVWAALTTRQANVALGDGRALRLAPEYGLFAATLDASNESLRALADLVRAHGEAALAETDPPPELPGLAIEPAPPTSQMVAAAPVFVEPDFEVVALGEADAPEMLELATLTRPGPFYRCTHRLGGFLGVRVDGRLAAMAGERLQPPGFTEVSAVCTHPDFRGRGYAAGLISCVTHAIVERGETPFLHVYDHNTAAVALYESLGWRRRRPIVFSFLTAE